MDRAREFIFVDLRREASKDARAKANARRLASGVDVSAIGIGTMSWGDASLGFGNSYRERDLAEAMKRAVDRG